VDKRKVISAYRRGFITLEECAQILGIDPMQVIALMEEQVPAEPPRFWKKRPVNG
jgi:predicted HTH domain antitoxin